MKVFLTSFFLILCISVSAQKDTALDTLPTRKAQLEYLAAQIVKTQFSDPKGLLHLAKTYDSISQLDPTPENRAEVAGYLGMGHYVVEEYDLAIDYYLESARQWEVLNNSGKLVIIYNRLAAAYNIRDDFPKTEAYFLKAKEVAKQSNDSLWVANINNNLSILYANNNLYEKAETVNKEALDYFLQKKDSVHSAISYMNLGNALLFGKKYEAAINAYQSAMHYTSPQKIPLLFAVSKTGIGIGLTETGKYREALPYLQEGLDLAKEIHYTEQIMESYNALAEYYSKTQNYKEAYFLKLESQKLKDSLLTATQDQNMANALTKYETEKKDAQLRVMTLENEKAEQQRNMYLYLAITGLIIAGLIGFFLYKNQKKNKLLAKQKALLEVTVDEKNVLLKETHHRVKNSFQIVSSLLYLQSENIKDQEGQLALKEAQNRVRSMVLIHQKLYSKDQLVGIEARDYILDLVRDILGSHQEDTQKLAFELEAETMVLSIETITPLGLILNELVTNVLKHAFPDTLKDPMMRITLKKEAGVLILEVSDNGKGMPQSIQESSFGIQLVRSLAKKLKGTLSYSQNKPQGTIAKLVFLRFSEL